MAKKLSNQIISNGGIAEPLHLDVTNLEQTKNVFEVLNQKYGVCDIVFCNAGIREITPMLDLEFEDWKKVIDVNVNGVFLSAQTFAKNCVKHNKTGNIVITASTLGIVAANSRCAYTTSKHATVGLTKQLAMDLAKNNIRVNALLFAGVKSKHQNKEFVKKYQSRIPIGRLMNSHEIIEPLTFLISEKNTYTTGTLLKIDGGYTLI